MSNDAFQKQVQEAIGEDFFHDLVGLLPRKLPIVDIFQTEFVAFVVVEAPGIHSPNDLTFKLQNNQMHITGEIPNTYPVKTEEMDRNERNKGPFERTLTLPFHYDPKTVRLTYRDGLFTIQFEKTDLDVELKVEEH
ncbi:MAG: Hsp20/alpha crystallin family protein [Bacilli bacterium]